MILLKEHSKRNWVYLLLKSVLIFIFVILLSILNESILFRIRQANDVSKSFGKGNNEYGLIFLDGRSIEEMSLENRKDLSTFIDSIAGISAKYNHYLDESKVILMNMNQFLDKELEIVNGGSLQFGCLYQASKSTQESLYSLADGTVVQTCGRIKGRELYVIGTGIVNTSEVGVILVDGYFLNHYGDDFGSSGIASLSFTVLQEGEQDELNEIAGQVASDIKDKIESIGYSAETTVRDNFRSYENLGKYMKEEWSITALETESLILLCIIGLSMLSLIMVQKNRRFISICLSQGISKMKLFWCYTLLDGVGIVIALMAGYSVIEKLELLMTEQVYFGLLISVLVIQGVINYFVLRKISTKNLYSVLAERKS